jgi:DNA-binding transcriptional LysR family regulator
LRRRDGTIERVVARRRVVVNDLRVAIAAAVAGLGVVCAPVDALVACGPELVHLSVVGPGAERAMGAWLEQLAVGFEIELAPLDRSVVESTTSTVGVER